MKSKLFIVFTMVVLFISGCRSSEKKEEVVQDANNYAEYNEELETTSSILYFLMIYYIKSIR